MQNKKPDGFLNDYYDSDSAALECAVGGNYQKWKLEIEVISQKLKIDCFGKNMGEIQNVIHKFNRLDCPITLNPSESTLLDVGIWAYFERRLTISTIEKRLRYARFMQNHQVPVNFYNPSYENFRRHMNFREQMEKASPNALIHEWKTMRMFLQAYGIPLWPYKPPIAPKHKKRIIPYPDIVRDFFYYDYTDDSYTNALYQYLFYHSFMIGWRVPSEIIEMKISDVIIDSKGRGSITITETKKRKSERTILPEMYILSSRSHKSMKNWIDIWRPKVENQYSGDALYLQSSGKPFTVRHLGHKLSKYGKKIWPDFNPYDMRHWCAIARLIDTKIESGSYDIYRIKNWLGHEDQKTTDNYVHYAEMYYNQYPKSWIQNALRSQSNIVRGKHKIKTRVCQKWPTLLKIPSRNRSGPAEICIIQQKGILGELFKIEKLSIFKAIQFISLKSFFPSFFNQVQFLFFKMKLSRQIRVIFDEIWGWLMKRYYNIYTRMGCIINISFFSEFQMVKYYEKSN